MKDGKKAGARLGNGLIRLGDVLVPLIFAFLVGSIFSLMCGTNPFTLYSYIIKRSLLSTGGLLNTLGYATPIIITGIATALSLRAGIFNMGIESQVILGGLMAALVGYMVPGLPKWLHIPLCLLTAAVSASALALIPGILKGKLRINEVVTTVMLNSITLQVATFLTNNCLGTGDAYPHTEYILETARLTQLNSRYRCTTALFLALAIWGLLYFLLKKTKLGYEIECIGRQWEFSDAMGMRVSRKIIGIFALGGAVAGIAGATEIMGVNYNFTPTFSANPGIGWGGFYVCILSGNHPMGILIYSIIFGALRYGAMAAQTGLGVPLDLINIIKSTLVLFMAVRLVSQYFPFFQKWLRGCRKEAQT